MKSYSFIILFLLAVFTTGCVKEIDELTTDREFFYEPMVTNVSGRITDKMGISLPMATVEMGGLTTTTDENGFFVFKNAVINKNGQILMASKDDYFSNWIYLSSNPSNVIFTECQLNEKREFHSFSSTTGGQIQVSGNTTMNISPNSFLGPGGSTYTGNVRMYIDMDSPGDAIDIWGSPIVRNEDNTSSILAESRKLQLIFENDSGERLELASPITITDNNSFQQEEQLFRIGLTNEAFEYTQSWSTTNSISNDGIYLIGKPESYIRISGALSSNNKAYTQTKIDIEYNGVASTTHTNTAGEYTGYIPANSEVRIFASQFGEQITESKILNTTNNDLTMIDLDIETQNEYALTTRILNCTNENATNAYLLISGQLPILATNGEVTIHMVTDKDSIDVLAVDLSADQKAMEYRIALNQDNILFPPIQACESTSGLYITYRLNDERVWNNNPVGGYIGSDLQFSANLPEFQNPGNFQDVVWELSGLPSNPVVNSAEMYIEQNNETIHGKCFGNCPADFQINIWNIGSQIGEIVTGRIKGKIPSFPPGSDIDFSCEFNFERTF